VKDDAERKTGENFAVLSAMLKAGMKSKPKLSAIEYARRLAVEKALQQRRYCDAFALWRVCPLKACRRQCRCRGEAADCLRRALDRVPHALQWQARQDILATTPHNIGAPERAARQCMPRDLYDLGRGATTLAGANDGDASDSLSPEGRGMG
jgi:hypothetical protein